MLHRKEITIEADFEAAPFSNEEAVKLVASKKSADPSLVVVKNIDTKFGIKKAVIQAYVYDSDENLKRIEPKKKEKNAGEKKESAEKPAEKPADSKEEAKADDKPAPKDDAKAGDKPAEENKS